MKKNSIIKMNKAVSLSIFAFLIIIICAFYLKITISAPHKGIMDGVYRNACCSDIVIKEPKISYGNESFNIKISDLKFGIVGVVSGKFTSTGIQKSEMDTWIAFSKEDGERVITLPVGTNFYRFKSVGSPN